MEQYKNRHGRIFDLNFLNQIKPKCSSGLFLTNNIINKQILSINKWNLTSNLVKIPTISVLKDSLTIGLLT